MFCCQNQLMEESKKEFSYIVHLQNAASALLVHVYEYVVHFAAAVVG